MKVKCSLCFGSIIYFVVAARLASAGILADSTADFSGTQGARGWSYGYFPNGDPNSFTTLPAYNSQNGTWQQTTCCPPQTQVGANSFAQPNGANNGTEQWAVREWISSFSGPIFVSGRLAKIDINSNSTGAYGRIYLNHKQMYNQFVSGTNYTGLTYSLKLTVSQGDVLDFALAPNGHDSNDLSLFSAIISSTSNTVEVDFAMQMPVHSASGFLFGLFDLNSPNPSLSPPNSVITPLQPKYWRVDPTRTWYQQVQAVAPNIPVDFLIPDGCSYGPAQNYCGLGPPWLNFPAFQNKFQALLAPLAPAPPNAIFEVWNEPDIGVFWGGTQEQFFETYLHLYQVVRAVLGPNAVVAGPSFSAYDRTTIQAFLEYCLANGCEVNSLTFHSLDDTAPDRTSTAALDARTSFVNNPRYAPLKINRIDINEMVSSVYTHQPAGTLAYYRQFELGGADGGSRSCWPDSTVGLGPQFGTAGDECRNGTLDGLLTSGTFQPRGVWYAHQAYADGVTSRVQSAVSDPNIVSLASRSLSSSGDPQILLGYLDFQGTTQKTVETRNFHVKLSHLDQLPISNGSSVVGLHLELIPDTGEGTLTGLQLIEIISAPISGGTAEFDLPPLSRGDVFRITLLPLDNPAPVLTTLSVSNTAAGGAGFSLGITGSGFDPASVVRWNGSDRPTTFVAATQLTVSIPATDIAAAGTVQITVLSPAPGGGTSTALTFTINNPVPTLRSLTPSSALAGGTAFTLSVTGTNFVSASVVEWNGSSRTTTFASATKLTVSIPATDIAAAGTAQVAVFNLLPGGGTSNSVVFTVVSSSSPFVPSNSIVNNASFAPGSNPVAPGTIVAIFGINLTDGTSCLPPSCNPTFGTNDRLNTRMSGAQVTINGTPVPIFYSSPNQLGVEIPTELTVTSAVVQVTVNGQASSLEPVAISPVSPGIFTFTSDGKGAGAFTHVDGSAVTQQSPARAGELVILYATGLGPVTPSVPTGALPVSTSSTIAATTLTIDSITVTPDFAGLAGCCVGLNQVNVRLPADTRSASNVPVVLTIGGVASNPVTIAVQ